MRMEMKIRKRQGKYFSESFNQKNYFPWPLTMHNNANIYLSPHIRLVERFIDVYGGCHRKS